MEKGSEVFQEQALTKASSCEAELQDLVHQVDIIVNSKKVEWERKMKALEAQMDIQHQELASTQSKLDQKSQEFSKLTHSYEKLLKQKNHHSREKCKESPETSFELSNLNKKLENMEASFSEMRNELQSRDALWRKIQLECQQLRAELLKVRENKDKQKTHRSSFVQLTEQSENKNADLQAQSQESQQEVLSKIRNHLYQKEPSHCSEQERIRTEISDLTEELHQKEITIATIMEKASLLERRLKTELQIKDKLLAKQQLLNFRYKVIKSENTHLKEIMENQKYKSCMSIDLSNKKHGDFTASIHKLEHENARLQNSLVKGQNRTETLMLGGMDKHGEKEHSYQTHSKMQEKEERTFQNEDERHMKLQQTAIFTASGYHRNCSPTSHGQGDIIGSKSDRALSYHKLDRGRQMELDDKSPSPPTEYPLCFGGLFPEKGRTGTLLSHAYDAEESKLSSSPETSFLATTEKFLQEEEKHTKEFEERLNSHLEELQRLSENTLKKYTGLQQSNFTERNTELQMTSVFLLMPAWDVGLLKAFGSFFIPSHHGKATASLQSETISLRKHESSDFSMRLLLSARAAVPEEDSDPNVRYEGLQQ
ncbi:deuterosome assembly protein 1 isoform X9 [Gallus gallus]|uniref:deuterosome assembly protein 1 isoform X9 n=1 Tax=Gallus gallus TaxID=9031 RepID=UPI001AE4E50D|nr:deuterosome assembly protein 1 isoform X9 [Gallus gallus]